MSKAVTEQELAEKAVAPRVTKANIDALKERITYTTEQRPGGTTSTFVHAFLDGKFFLATGFSACVNAEKNWKAIAYLLSHRRLKTTLSACNQRSMNSI